jgi:predicted pyridoxine 5'-phosphate oxidase superfamily flavin-nucleotide-binding protein
MLTINEEQKQLIENNAVAVATVDESGNPHCIAVAAVKVISPNQVLITDNFMNQTPKNIQFNTKAAFAVWNKDWQKDCFGYEFIGTAEYFSDGQWLEMVKKLEENINLPAKGAILITIEKAKRLA